MSDDRNFKIASAHANSANQFALGLSLFPIDMEDSYARYLIFDGSLDRPWSVVEANRNASDITYANGEYFALSEEEYVHVLTGQTGTTEEIKGMGVHADRAKYGSGLEINEIDGELLIAGQGRQIYRRDGKDNWVKLPVSDIVTGAGQDDVDFNGLDGNSFKDIICCGTTSPAFQSTPKDLEAQMSAAIEVDDDEELLRLMELDEANDPKPEGRAYHWDGEAWTQIDVEDYFPKTVFVDRQNRTWLGCNQGTVLQVERDEDGEFDVDDIEIIEDSRTDIYSITEFKGRLILASAEGLFAYDENFDSLDDEIVRIKPKLNKALGPRPSPLKVQAVDDVMFYFDYNLGIYIWDGNKKWTNIPIPPELLERDFKNLKP